MDGKSRVQLTTGRVEAFICPADKSQAFLWDSEVRGLGVRATPAGKRSPKGGRAFVFQGYLRNGDKPRLTIGDTKIWTLDRARAEARRLHTLIDQGIDPRLERSMRNAEAEARRVAEQRAATTFEEAWSVYVRERDESWGEHSKKAHVRAMCPGGKPRPSRGRGPDQSDKTLPGLLYPLASVRLISLDAELLRPWMDGANKRGKTQAANTFRMLRAFLRWCEERTEFKGLVDVGACLSMDVRAKVQSNQAKNDCLQREQLECWFRSVKEISSPIVSAYLQCVLLTGARPNEIEELRWECVDFQWKTLAISDKVEGTRVIPLTPYVSQLLQELYRSNQVPPPEYRILVGKKIRNDVENWRPSPWVFRSSTSASGHIETPREALSRATRSAGLPDLTINGLRRSFGTLTEWVECPTGIVAQIQGHKPSATAEKHYRVRPIDLLRMWHTKIEAWILEQAGIEQPSEEVKPGLRAVTAA